MAADLVSWVGDQLYEILGLSDRYTAEFLIGLAKKCPSVTSFTTKLEETGALTVDDDRVKEFASQLWDKVPHKSIGEKPARAKEREAVLQNQKNRSYQLLYDSDNEDTAITPAKKSNNKKGSLLCDHVNQYKCVWLCGFHCIFIQRILISF